MKTERCIVHLLNPTDLERSVDDPRLAKLMDDGWRVISQFNVETRAGIQQAALVLAPPEKTDWAFIKRWLKAGVIGFLSIEVLAHLAIFLKA